MHAVGDLPASSKLRGPPMAPSLSGTRSWTGRAAVNRPVYLKNSPWWSILPVSSMVRRTDMASLTRPGAAALHWTWYWLSITRLPKLTTASACPGELVQGGQLLGDQGRVAQDHVGDVGPHADVAGLVGRGREQQPHVLVVDLVDAVAGVEAQVVGGLDHVDRVAKGIVGGLHVAEPDHRAPLPLGQRRPTEPNIAPLGENVLLPGVPVAAR